MTDRGMQKTGSQIAIEYPKIFDVKMNWHTKKDSMKSDTYRITPVISDTRPPQHLKLIQVTRALKFV